VGRKGRPTAGEMERRPRQARPSFPDHRDRGDALLDSALGARL